MRIIYENYDIFLNFSISLNFIFGNYGFVFELKDEKNPKISLLEITDGKP